MSEQRNFGSHSVQFIKIPQSFTDFPDRPLRTLADVHLLAEDLGKLDRVVASNDPSQPPKATWGTIVYRVNEDSSLTVYSSKVDSSD